MDKVRLRFLGSGDAFGSGGRLQACLHLDGAGESLLLDCGATGLIALKRARIDPAGIGWVALSHLHGDHFAGIPWLILDGQFADRSRPLVIAGPAEGEAVAEVLGALAPWRPAVARDWRLDHLAALLDACAGYVGADSGITHLAAAAGVPVVAVFGPTDPALWAPRGPRVAIVRHPVPCQPCTWEAMWGCAHRACLTALTPDAVLAAAVRCFGLE
jgi:hypothetical protein